MGSRISAIKNGIYELQHYFKRYLWEGIGFYDQFYSCNLVTILIKLSSISDEASVLNLFFRSFTINTQLNLLLL